MSVPAAVTSLTGVSATPTTIDLAWTLGPSGDNITKYTVYWSLTGNAPWSSVDVAANLAVKQLTALTPNTTYYIYITATNATGESLPKIINSNTVNTIVNGQQQVMDAISTLLKGAAVNAAVGGRIYDGEAAINAANPFVTFKVISDPPTLYFAVDSLDMAVQVDIFGDFHADPKATRMIADSVFATMHRAALTVTGYNSVTVLCEDRGSVETEFIAGGITQKDKWRVIQQYKIQGSGT